MENLLYLTHRIPYPPNKGDKIRSYHLLKFLSERYRVYLGTFIDAEEDWQYAENVKNLCADTCLVRLDPKMARLRCLEGFITGSPLTLPYYYDKTLKKWVDNTLETQSITKVVAFSAAMAQYVPNIDNVKRIIDFVDIDSDKWKQYAQSKSWPLSSVYRRESALLFDYEKQIAREFDTSTFVSLKEADLFKKMASDVSGKVDYFNNGVDVDFFSPGHSFPNPYSSGDRVLVFTGAMDYWANVDAVEWFAQSVFPLICSKIADVQFYIVGSNPTREVLALGELQGITVTGKVDDVRPYLKFSSVAIAPLRIARGIQNKVLEAMAMEKTVVASPQAVEGIQAKNEEELYVADGSQAFADRIVALLENENSTVSTAARERILADYTWPASLARLDHLLMLKS